MPQFSKIIIVLSNILLIIGVAISIIATLYLGLPSEVAIAIITLTGSIVATAQIFYYKKAQLENIIKIYMASYKEIAELKKDPKYLDSMQEKIEDKLDVALDTAISDATTPIEIQDTTAVG